jgi:hypothetical protein
MPILFKLFTKPLNLNVAMNMDHSKDTFFLGIFRVLNLEFIMYLFEKQDIKMSYFECLLLAKLKNIHNNNRYKTRVSLYLQL